MVQGLDALNRRWGAVPERVKEAVRQELEAQAERIVQEMRSIAPKRTGRLAASINWTWGRAPAGSMTIGTVSAGGKRAGSKYATMSITLYAGDSTTTARQRRASGTRRRDANRSGYFDANYARYLEFGTSRMRARPFFYPVWRARRRSVKTRVARAISKAIKQT